MDFACIDSIPGACDCPDGWDCVDGHCVQPGRCFPRDGLAGLRCQPGLHCDDHGLCRACTLNEHCDGGRCEDGECLAPQECANSGDCYRGYECRQGFCSILRDACDEDPLNNHDFGSATRLPPLGVSGLVACEGRSDWFLIDDPIGTRVTVRYDAETTRIGMKIYTQRELGRTPTDIGTIIDGETWANVGAGQYTVFAHPGWVGNTALSPRVHRLYRRRLDRPWRNDDVNNARHLGIGSQVLLAATSIISDMKALEAQWKSPWW